jgi:hypothetical protein
MTEIQIWRSSGIHTAQSQGSMVDGSGSRSRSRRAARRLWILMHAQALLNGTTGSPGNVAFIEDDRQRLAGRRAR